MRELESRKLNVFQRNRRFLLLLLDVLSITVSYLIPWILISGRTSLGLYRGLLFSSCVLFVLCYVTVFVTMGLYDSLWRYAEMFEFARCALASVIAVGSFAAVTIFIYTERKIPLSVYIMSSLFAVLVTLYIRLLYRMVRDAGLMRKGTHRKRVMVVGAGDAGSTLINEIFKDPNTDYNIVCIVDDDPDKFGHTLLGVKVMGNVKEIPTLVEQCGIDTILIAIPSADESERKRVLDICSKTACNMRLLPDISRLISDGRELLSAVRDVKVEDLLGREQIDLGTAACPGLEGKVILVTGGGGSIGSELCLQIAATSPKKLILLDVYENNAYDVEQQLKRRYGADFPIEVKICSVRDERKICALFEKEHPQIVFHAAAHKHVPLMETSPEEAIKNNVCGTYNVAFAADRFEAETFVMISTDKAVNPTSIMGASKRICEMVVQEMSRHSKTRFCAVRFGNVLGSNGSVIPLFKEQIAAGGPVTVTHPDIIRYFMTIPEAVSLVLKASEIAKGGEIFVLDMGEPVRILDLAENLIRLAGFLPHRDIPIEFVGLRPGEKLYEELLLSEEGTTETSERKIFVGNLALPEEGFFGQLGVLTAAAEKNDSGEVVRLIKELVPNYVSKPTSEL